MASEQDLAEQRLKTQIPSSRYAPTVVLNFPIFSLLNGPGSTYVNLGWPHVSVATLRKSFG